MSERIHFRRWESEGREKGEQIIKRKKGNELEVKREKGIERKRNKVVRSRARFNFRRIKPGKYL